METNYYQKASEYMKARKYGLAIKNFELHLQNSPQDYKALMQQGICYYLNDSVEQFLKISHKIENLFAAVNKLPSKIRLMWRNYKSLARKVAATAMISGTLLSTAAACGKTEQKTVQDQNLIETTTSEQQNKKKTPVNLR
ncbi:MAG: hypothetical protein PF689_02965, partial [Deltaproteobacteria bacterium]|nr:hypothetical protein [Deltaproteobacteria bacterium]